MNVLKQLKQFYWAERKWLILSLICLTFSTALGLIYPFLLGYLIDDVIRVKAFDLVPKLALLVVAVMTVKAVFQYFHGFTGGVLGNKVAYNMRNALYHKLQYLSPQYYDRAKTGDLMSRLTADLEGIRNFIGHGFAQIINMFLMIGLGMTAMAIINWKIMLICMIPMPIIAFVAIKFESRIHPSFRSIRRSFSSLTTAVQENIAGVRTVKSFAREPHEVEKFMKVSDEYRETHVKTASIWARFFPALEFLAQSTVFILIMVGGIFVINDDLAIGELVTLSSVIWYIIGPMWMLGFHINNYTMSKTSGERILEILNTPVHVKNMTNAKVIDPAQVKGDVKFDHVTFSYPDNEPSLVDFDLHAPAGSTIGILGGTGSGKSTIIQLLLRAYNVKHGKLTLDGIDIEQYDLESLRHQIGLVFQETFLFSSTIRNNIAYGNREASMDEIIRVAKLAQAHDFIMELPQGYDTIVGERGLGLSGGQKQRIAIARALLKDPKILILDDSTSAVDMETEHVIQQGLREIMQGRTTFIIAHRISSLKHADEILVLEQGKVVQRGTHEELLQQEGPYLQTYNIQYADRPQQGHQRRWAN